MPSSQQSGLKATLGAPGKETLTCRVEGGDGGGRKILIQNSQSLKSLWKTCPHLMVIETKTQIKHSSHKLFRHIYFSSSA